LGAKSLKTTPSEKKTYNYFLTSIFLDLKVCAHLAIAKMWMESGSGFPCGTFPPAYFSSSQA
jgi:hypothetical protein